MRPWVSRARSSSTAWASRACFSAAKRRRLLRVLSSQTQGRPRAPVGSILYLKVGNVLKSSITLTLGYGSGVCGAHCFVSELLVYRQRGRSGRYVQESRSISSKHEEELTVDCGKLDRGRHHGYAAGNVHKLQLCQQQGRIRRRYDALPLLLFL